MRRLLGVILLFAGCASLGVKTQGTSGPINWHVDNIDVVTREIQGKPYTGQAFTVVLKNVSDRTVTFTRYEETRYAPGVNPLMQSYSGQWILRPDQEWKLDRFAYLSCGYGGGCVGGGNSNNMSRFIFTGQDDQGQPVKAQLDMTLPPAATGFPPIR